MGLLGQLMRCRSSPATSANAVMILASSAPPPFQLSSFNPLSTAAAAATAASSPGVASICRDFRKLLLNRPYGKKRADPEDEKMLSEGGGSKNNYGKECSRVKSTKPKSTIEKVFPGKRNTQLDMKNQVKNTAKKVKKVVEKVADTAKEGLETAKKKAGDAAKKVKKGGGGGGGKKGGGGGGKKKGGGGDGGGKKKGGGGGGGGEKKKGGGGGGGGGGKKKGGGGGKKKK
ncbi:hypothetical protein SELMODRAFT_417539 [Selaginella moellendorffii]|uniref:Uncharacterized protein n=1 Tax=Selaginella moellendorffii TaxID=88036 RepID=D8S2T0_SELML|nr:hypothetical protein SELMODRAFT_417539 [Selaginella moellendorffii]